MKIRVAIREQLAILVILAVLVALAVVSIPVWVFVNGFVVGVEIDGLSLTASLKAARIASEIDLLQSTAETISSRLLLQQNFEDFYAGNLTGEAFDDAKLDLLSALVAKGGAGLYQAKLFSRNTTGDAHGVLNVTGPAVDEEYNIQLPYLTADGRRANLSSNESWGYPPMLYPNITYINTGKPNAFVNGTEIFLAQPFPNVSLNNGGGLLLGPVIINSSFALVSITIPVRSNSIGQFILGYMTLIASAASIISTQRSEEGLGDTGVVLIIGPTNAWNRFSTTLDASNGTKSPPYEAFRDAYVRFLLPPAMPDSGPDRHASHSFGSGNYDGDFLLSKYPAALDVFYNNNTAPNNATAVLSTVNEEGIRVAVGAARPQSAMVTWAVLVEQADSEVLEPINVLRQILMGSVFGTLGLILLLVVPCAHVSVLPIRRLKEATENSIAPPGYEDDFDEALDEEDPSSGGTTSGQMSEKKWVASILRQIRKKRRARARTSNALESRRRHFKVPARVDDGKHFVTDELTELTETFNAMTDELLKQYTSLDKKVAERTKELEISKKAAEAANESKTLFIANISHELKTPLNGIMGMAAVCMEEDDVAKIKQSLNTLYKSGDLLLHLLEDLLSFSKNQIGQQVRLEEREFRLGDIRSQISSIFDKQVRESKIAFSASFVAMDMAEGNGVAATVPESPTVDKRLPALGPPGLGRLKDMCVWGDQHRILQVLINLVSNSLKFTPAGGKVDLRIRCLGEVEQMTGDESRTSSMSRAGRTRHRASNQSASSRVASSNAGTMNAGTALAINPMDPKVTPHVYVRERERPPTPPPANARKYLFEFEVEDTGPGIAEHMQQKIFEPFVQGDLGLSKKFGGTGLGLSICSQLATIMGGSIHLTSTPGVGTVFTMRIPLKYVTERPSSAASSSLHSMSPSIVSPDVDHSRKAPGEQKASKADVLDKQPRLVGLRQPFFATNPHLNPTSNEKEKAAIDRARANKEGQGKLRVLVADDNSTNIEVVSRLLKLEDVYDVTVAKDGQEAFDLVKANMEKNQFFDVIFMDIQMPNVDGLQSTRLIRQMGYSAPIVALTAFSEESNVKECIESGMNEFLSKPIRRPALKQVLKKFATIPEEPEPATVSKATPKTTPDPSPDPSLNTKPPAAVTGHVCSEDPRASGTDSYKVNGTEPHKVDGREGHEGNGTAVISEHPAKMTTTTTTAAAADESAPKTHI